MFETYPKGNGSLPKEVKPKAQKTDSVYLARPSLGKSDETRQRNLMSNDYGKTPQKQDVFDGGVRVLQVGAEAA